MSNDYRGIGARGEDDVLRQMIRESIARHSGAVIPSVPPRRDSPVAAFVTFASLRSGDDTGACVIEPSVRCNHCGYCLSYGH